MRCKAHTLPRLLVIVAVLAIFTILAGFVILGQTMTAQQLAGAALVIAAVFAVRLRKPATG